MCPWRIWHLNESVVRRAGFGFCLCQGMRTYSLCQGMRTYMMLISYGRARVLKTALPSKLLSAECFAYTKGVRTLYNVILLELWGRKLHVTFGTIFRRSFYIFELDSHASSYDSQYQRVSFHSFLPHNGEKNRDMSSRFSPIFFA